MVWPGDVVGCMSSLQAVLVLVLAGGAGCGCGLMDRVLLCTRAVFQATDSQASDGSSRPVPHEMCSSCKHLGS